MTGGSFPSGDQRHWMGKFDPSLPLAFKLADLFNLPIEEIFFRDGTDNY
jgi:DNA-binding XRE family transcriptional regulator